MAQYIDTSYIRSEIRLMVDPLLMKLREELMGSGVSFGRIAAGAMPTTVITIDGGGDTTDITSYGFITGISTYSGGTLIATNQKELSFINASVTTAGNRTTVTIPTVAAASGYSDPLTTNGDLLYRAGGITTRLPIGTEDQFLRVSGGLPIWETVTTSGLLDPTTTTGDMLYKTGGVLDRLPIGASGYILTSNGVTPYWAIAPSGTGGMSNPMTTLGDIIYAASGGAPTRLGIGSEGKVLGVQSGIPAWITISGGSSGGNVLAGDVGVNIPGLAASPDRLGAGGGSISEEYNTSSTGLTWGTAPGTENSNSTILSHLYTRWTASISETIGSRSWAPGSGAFDARTKIAVGVSNTSSTSYVAGLHIGDSGNSNRLLVNLSINSATATGNIIAYSYAGGTYTQRGNSHSVATLNDVWLRITRDGSNNISFYYSLNGLTWVLIGTHSMSLTVSNIGYRINPQSTNEFIFISDWLRASV